jgi:hypothetical protein
MTGVQRREWDGKKKGENLGYGICKGFSGLAVGEAEGCRSPMLTVSNTYVIHDPTIFTVLQGIKPVI